MKTLRMMIAILLCSGLCLGQSSVYVQAVTTTSSAEVLFGSSVVDGSYAVEVETDEELVVEHALLTVKNGQMTLLLLLPDNEIAAMYLGTKEEASEASEDRWLPAVVNNAKKSTFTLPISVLDQKLSCASYNEKTEVWSGHTILVRSSSLPREALQKSEGIPIEELHLADGSYETEVELYGGSGRASIQSPVEFEVKDDQVTATIIWSSNHYDYMIVGEEKILYDGSLEFSTFEIPVEVFDHAFPVIANTTAMSTPHEIQYQLVFDSDKIRDKSTQNNQKGK